MIIDVILLGLEVWMISLKTLILYTTWFALLLIFTATSRDGNLALPKLDVLAWTAFILFCAFMALFALVDRKSEHQRASRFGFAIFGYSAILATMLPSDVAAFYSWGDLILIWTSPAELDPTPSLSLPNPTPKNMINLILVSFVAVLGSMLGAFLSRKQSAG